MEHAGVHDTLSLIHQAFDEEEYERSLALSRDLKEKLIAAAGACDPMDLGWARFYEFKSLYQLCEYEGAYNLLGRPEAATYAVPQKNAAYMYSVGSELAMHLGRAEEVVCWGEKCLEMRLEAEDFVAAVQCANTVCVLLARMERDDLNTRFARRLIDIGKETGAERPLIAGHNYLAANVARSGKQRLMSEAAAGLPLLKAIHDDRFSAEAIEAIEAIWRAPWYEHALAPEPRRRFLVERSLIEAANEGEVGVVRDLLAAGVDVNATDGLDFTALMRAAFAGHVEVVRCLLDAGADPDRENIQRRTAIIQAADQNHVAIVEMLLTAGAELDRQGIHDQTALIVASWQGQLASVSALLDAGADTEIRDVAGNTALTVTATEDQPAVIALLLRAGAEIEARNPTGQTALMNAAMEGQPEVVDALLGCGADAAAVDEHGLTAADWAAQEGFDALATRLSKAARRN